MACKDHTNCGDSAVFAGRHRLTAGQTMPTMAVGQRAIGIELQKQHYLKDELISLFKSITQGQLAQSRSRTMAAAQELTQSPLPVITVRQQKRQKDHAWNLGHGIRELTCTTYKILTDLTGST